MKTLPPPVGDFLERYRQAVRGKEREDYRATLEALEGAVDGRYDEYQEKKKTLENVMVIERTADQISALESCYSQTLKRELLNNLRDRLPKFDDEALFEGAPPRLRCPYCQIEPASRWDHFLPSSIFPDYFMYSPNLIYVCEVCNNEIKKSGLYGPVRSTIHPYYDEIDRAEYLVCSVEVVDGKLSANYFINENPNGGDPYVGAVAHRHFVEYGLKEKFLGETGSRIGALVDAYMFRAETSAVTEEDMKIFIATKLGGLFGKGHGKSSWEVALWTGLLGCGGLIDFLERVRAVREAKKLAPKAEELAAAD